MLPDPAPALQHCFSVTASSAPTQVTLFEGCCDSLKPNIAKLKNLYWPEEQLLSRYISSIVKICFSRSWGGSKNGKAGVPCGLCGRQPWDKQVPLTYSSCSAFFPPLRRDKQKFGIKKCTKFQCFRQCCGSESGSSDPNVFGPPGSGSRFISQRYGSGSGSGIRILLSSSKNSKKNLDSYCFVTSFWLFIFAIWCKCTFKKNFFKLAFCWRLEGQWRK